MEKRMALIVLIFYIQNVTGFTTSSNSYTVCSASTANIDFNITLEATESILGTKTWIFGANKIAENNGTSLIPTANYSSRLTAYGTHGISLSNVDVADTGTYAYVIVVLPSRNPFTATAILSVNVAPLAPSSGCTVNASQSSNTVTCAVNNGSGKCGVPTLNAYWSNVTSTTNQFECIVGGVYRCCAVSAALSCYSGRLNDFCTTFNCTSVNKGTPVGGKIRGVVYISIMIAGVIIYI